VPRLQSLRVQGREQIHAPGAGGVDRTENFRRAATYVDRILKGTSPSELPVQSPVKFQLVINLRTAKALGLTIPEAVMQRADEIID
jgi:putative tryptophan/tyrosine transport system substrate-binding protein